MEGGEDQKSLPDATNCAKGLQCSSVLIDVSRLNYNWCAQSETENAPMRKSYTYSHF